MPHASHGGKNVADTVNSESPAPAPLSTEIDSSDQTGTKAELATGQAPPDAQVLVDRMVAAGEWPEPALLEKIVDAGDAAVAPLISFVRTYPRGWPPEAPLNHAMTMLSILRPRAAIPELIEIIRRYSRETGELAAELVGSFGAVAFEPLLNVCRDQAVTGYARNHAISAALGAAGNDQSLRARLADVVRPMLADVIERFRQAKNAAKAAGADLLNDETIEDDSDAETASLDDYDDEMPEDDSEMGLLEVSEIDDDPDDDQIEGNSENPEQEFAERGPDLYSDVFHLVNELAALADPEARDLIQTAFDENMVETFFMDRKFVERQYQRGGEPAPERPDWLESYREEYRNHHTAQPSATPKPLPLRAPRPERESERAASTQNVQVQTPLRKTGPALGRNEPCWCGSGKKFKKCHLGKDSTN
jgi:SEC-C motif